MATSKTISAALKLVDTKKQNLKKAYDDLQSHSSLLSSLPLSWPDLDSHFTTLHNTLSQRFLHLQTLESQLHQNHTDPSSSPSQLPNPNPKNQNFSSDPNDPSSSSNPTTHLEALTAFCKNNDGKGLRTYIGDNFKDKGIMKDELQSAFKSASNPADMVLDAIEGVFVANAVIDGKEPRFIKKSFNFLLQQLRVFSPYVSFDLRKKAKRLFNEWKVNLMNENSEPSWTLAFLQFVAVYGFLSELTLAELAAYSATASASDDLIDLYQIIALSDRVQGIIHKLIERSKHILAVKYIFHFKLTDTMPPVPILKAYVDDAQKLAKRLASEGKPNNEVKSREIHALKSVIKVIESYNLDSEFPRASIEQRIDELYKQRRVGGKTAAPAAFAAKPQQQLSGIKRRLTAAPFGPASTIHQYQQPHFPPTSLLPEHPNPYTSMPPAPFGMKAPTPTVPSYTVPMATNGNLNQSVSHPNSSQQPLVMPGYYASMGPNSNLGQGGSHPNPSESRVMPGYYAPMSSSGNADQGSSHPNPSASGGYGLQHYYG
ncbi:truncated FRIGIDA-like protein 1 [Lathyrus oleraceus]|uniref:FRIGIDA-like protein n=1 Tax=Pisum sativum TaxID=3888 RepID=A0A9D5B7L4_PEA|nr:truncated FRIGIDA-like protein 1 [Pisum sativum]KAI5432861.1 hypothetical protein KIW84_020245 [Pisum sativum]